MLKTLLASALFAGLIAGDDAIPPVSPIRIPAPFLLTLGQQAFVQIRVCRRDGRLSGKFRGSVDVTTG